MVLCSIEALKREKQQENFRKVLWGIFTNTWCASKFMQNFNQDSTSKQTHSSTMQPQQLTTIIQLIISTKSSPMGACIINQNWGKTRFKTVFHHKIMAIIFETHLKSQAIKRKSSTQAISSKVGKEKGIRRRRRIEYLP